MHSHNLLLALIAVCLVPAFASADLNLAQGTKIVFGDGSTLETAPDSDLSIPAGHGGTGNTVSGTHAYVGGGYDNAASGFVSTVSGGGYNVASNNHATVAGGMSNTASGIRSAIGGGQDNQTTASFATIPGGALNTAGGYAATVGGGKENTADGAFSFAAGVRAKIAFLHSGTFLFSDQNAPDFESQSANEFAVRATSGVRFVTAIDGSGNTVHQISMDSSGNLITTGSVNPASDRDAKENFQPINPLDILEKLAALPISTWNYKSQDPAVRNIGPTAQDFAAAFNLGFDNKHIATVNADGIAFAAIQGLHKQLDEKQQHIAALEARLAQLEAKLEALATGP